MKISSTLAWLPAYSFSNIGNWKNPIHKILDISQEFNFVTYQQIFTKFHRQKNTKNQILNKKQTKVNDLETATHGGTFEIPNYYRHIIPAGQTLTVQPKASFLVLKNISLGLHLIASPLKMQNL